jgi:hypothetical protein
MCLHLAMYEISTVGDVELTVFILRISRGDNSGFFIRWNWRLLIAE